MIRLLTLLLLLSMPLMAAETTSATSASQTSGSRNLILIVDIKHILDESKAAIGAQKKIEVQRSAFQDEITGQEKQIRDAEQALLQQRGKLDEKAYAEKENQLRQKFRDVEKYVQERRQALEKATSQSMGKVHAVMQDIVRDIAKKRGAQAVLAKQEGNLAVLWAADGNDITSEVTERLNAQLPEIPVDIDLSGVKKPAAKQ